LLGKIPESVPLEIAKTVEGEELRGHTTQYLLYQHIVKEVRNNERRLLPEFKKTMLERIGKEGLEEYIKIDRLGSIFESFYTQNQEQIDKDLADPNNYAYGKKGVYFFSSDKLQWRGEIHYCFFNYNRTQIKSVDIKLINDGFIYTKQYLNESKKYSRSRHGSSN
jgi:hypothetical protein